MAYNWLTLALSAIGLLLIPILVFIVRGAIKWTRTEDQLATLVEDLRELITDKDRVHTEILEQMRMDRDATDRRLRYIEEFWMDQGRQRRGSRSP